MIEENVARSQARRKNIDRYNRLLRTSLTALERDFIERRIAEEQFDPEGSGMDRVIMRGKTDA